MILACILAGNTASAQVFSKAQAINVGYLGHLGIHPGVFVSVECFQKERKLTRPMRPKTVITKTWFAVHKVGFYHHYGNQNVFGLGTDMLQRRETSKRFYQEFGIGPKIIVGFNAGETYIVEWDGSVKRPFLAASMHLAINTSYTAGWRLNKLENTAPSLFMRLNAGWMLNYNNTLVPSVNLELGYKHKLVFEGNDNLKKESQ